jgi:hypothetical protein
VIRIAGLSDIPTTAWTGTVNVAGVTPIPPAISIAIPSYHATLTAWAMNAACVCETDYFDSPLNFSNDLSPPSPSIPIKTGIIAASSTRGNSIR